MEQTQRVNAAIELLRKKATPGEVVSALSARFDLSSRQAHRYLQRAQEASRPLSPPEAKEAFTVKLPKGLIQEVRLAARQRKLRISDLTAKALRGFLQENPYG